MKETTKPHVQSTYYETSSTPGDFLKQAHPAVGTLPIITQRQHFYRLTQPGERGTFFASKGRSGTSAIAKSAVKDDG